MYKRKQSGLRILITNNTLASRAGSELYVRDLAIALMKLGHHPVAYSSVLGDVAEELRLATIPVIDDLGKLSTPPDIIHGQHHLETMAAVLHFPNTPAVYVCHGWLPWEELPPRFPSIHRYVAVDDLCRERLLTSGAIPETNIEVIHNFVDLDRFQPREALPTKPSSALIFSNYAGDGPMLTAIRAACTRFGIERVDVVGGCSGNLTTAPENILGNYDVVFAKARCALEAMASGCAVVVADFAGLGGLVTTENVARMRQLNFGVRTMQSAALTEANVLRELQHYTADDAAQVSRWIRANAAMSSTVTRWLQVYARVLDDWQCLPESTAAKMPGEQLLAASQYLRILAPLLKTRHEAELRAVAANEQCMAREHETELRAEADAARLMALEEELNQIHASRAWKTITGYRKLRAWLNRS